MTTPSKIVHYLCSNEAGAANDYDFHVNAIITCHWSLVTLDNFLIFTSYFLNFSRFETRSLPTLTRSYLRRFTFYVARPSAPFPNRVTGCPRSIRKSSRMPSQGMSPISLYRQPA